MRDAPGQLAHGIKLLRLLQRQFRRTAVGDVGQHNQRRVTTFVRQRITPHQQIPLRSTGCPQGPFLHGLNASRSSLFHRRRRGAQQVRQGTPQWRSGGPSVRISLQNGASRPR